MSTLYRILTVEGENGYVKMFKSYKNGNDVRRVVSVTQTTKGFISGEETEIPLNNNLRPMTELDWNLFISLSGLNDPSFKQN